MCRAKIGHKKNKPGVAWQLARTFSACMSESQKSESPKPGGQLIIFISQGNVLSVTSTLTETNYERRYQSAAQLLKTLTIHEK